jgi:hypothetical protein
MLASKGKDKRIPYILAVTGGMPVEQFSSVTCMKMFAGAMRSFREING